MGYYSDIDEQHGIDHELAVESTVDTITRLIRNREKNKLMCPVCEQKGKPFCSSKHRNSYYNTSTRKRRNRTFKRAGYSQKFIDDVEAELNEG